MFILQVGLAILGMIGVAIYSYALCALFIGVLSPLTDHPDQLRPLSSGGGTDVVARRVHRRFSFSAQCSMRGVTASVSEHFPPLDVSPANARRCGRRPGDGDTSPKIACCEAGRAEVVEIIL